MEADARPLVSRAAPERLILESKSRTPTRTPILKADSKRLGDPGPERWVMITSAIHVPAGAFRSRLDLEA
jgi:hypothetical protein